MHLVLNITLCQIFQMHADILLHLLSGLQVERRKQLSAEAVNEIRFPGLVNKPVG